MAGPRWCARHAQSARPPKPAAAAGRATQFRLAQSSMEKWDPKSQRSIRGIARARWPRVRRQRDSNQRESDCSLHLAPT